MSKARELADLGSVTTRLDEVGNTDGALSNRNLIINGAMQVAQRGTSSTVNAASTAYRTVDRFEGDFFGSSWTGVNHTTEDQSTDAPDGFSRSLKFTALTSQDYSSALGSWVQYTFENQDIVGLRSGNGLKDFTISFWVKANKTGNVSVSLENDYSYSTYVTISAANTWERKTLTIPATTNNMGIDYAASPNGGDLKLKLGMGSNGSWLVDTDNQWNDATTNRGVLSPQQTNFHASVSDYIAFTGVQLEVGDTATPFEHRSYGDELQRCQRYYQQIAANDDYDFLGTGYIENGSKMRFFVRFSCDMRATPTGSSSGSYRAALGSIGDQDITFSSFANAGLSSARLEFTGSSLAVGEGCMLMGYSGAALKFDAEL